MLNSVPRWTERHVKGLRKSQRTTHCCLVLAPDWTDLTGGRKMLSLAAPTWGRALSVQA